MVFTFHKIFWSGECNFYLSTGTLPYPRKPGVDRNSAYGLGKLCDPRFSGGCNATWGPNACLSCRQAWCYLINGLPEISNDQGFKDMATSEVN